MSDFTNSIPAQRKGLAVYPEGYTLSPFSISSMHISNSKMHSCVPHDTINQMYAGTEMSDWGIFEAESAALESDAW